MYSMLVLKFYLSKIIRIWNKLFDKLYRILGPWLIRETVKYL